MWHRLSHFVLETLESFSLLAALRRKRKSSSSSWYKKKNDRTTSHPENNPAGRLVENAEFVWHTFLFIRAFFPPLFCYCVWNGRGSCLWHSTGGQVICGGKCEENGCFMMSMFSIQTPLALRIALLPHFFVFYFPLSLLFSLSSILFYVKGNKNSNLLNIYLQPFKEHTQQGERS